MQQLRCQSCGRRCVHPCGAYKHKRRRTVFLFHESFQHGAEQEVETRGGFTAWFPKIKVLSRRRGFGCSPEKTSEQEQEEELEQIQRH